MKYLNTYFICYLTFCVSYYLFGESHFQAAIIFQTLLLWAINEIWYQLLAWPTLIVAVAKRFLHKGEDDISPKLFQKIVRWTSVLILLLPHFIYMTLFLLNIISKNMLTEQLKLSFNSSLFISSYLACLVLFILGFFTKIQGLSLIDLFNEDALGDDQDKVNSYSTAPPPASTRPKQASPSHKIESYSLSTKKHLALVDKQLEDSEEMMLHTVPVPYSFNQGTRQLFLCGIFTSLFAVCFVGITITHWGQFNELYIRWIFLGASLLTTVFAIALLCSPYFWRKRLEHVDFFITNLRVIICDRHQLRSIYWKDSPLCHLFIHPDGCGSIYITERSGLMGKVSQTLDKLFGPSTSNYSETEKNHKDRLSGIIHVSHAEEIYKTVEELNNHNTK